ncbi:type I-E CRISPR-associated protein Cas5/CasD [Sulfobacillus thermosulfidooxidans]|uniref:type I-E CRISPR-associated protein Cas5/CasD n=1 Tax=Sulfobacillus thermosulfidooxidans TaxID=28034 RepID=UPI0012FDAD21|nr:type I-E CRISPR-associated protein Cas5/CasD [Sulfobacillus thermosulfidooxidans]
MRLDGPLMSFGTTIVDQNGFISDVPSTSMLTGLIANALGYDHQNVDKLTDLQRRLDFAARWDVRPTKIVDYQTVDLSQPKMTGPFWSPRETTEDRGGGSAARVTHQRFRHYWMDGLMTVALSVAEGESPTLDDIMNAVKRPQRPLFMGRKNCLPSRPFLDPTFPITEGPDILTILRKIPHWNRLGHPISDSVPCEYFWTQNLPVPCERFPTYDLRDWRNQIFSGRILFKAVLEQS